MLKRLLLNKELIFKLLALSAITLLYFGRSFNDFKTPYVKGDGFEYILMTEAISNHFTPDLRIEDIISFKKKFEKYHKWDDFFKRDVIDNQIERFKVTTSLFKETTNGFYANHNKTWFSYHFFFYSYLNTPAYILGKHYGPIRPFYFTNAILVIITCIVILFFTPFGWFNSILAAMSFAFSASYWYLSWQHTEILTMSLLAIALINFFNKKRHWALFFVAVACLQNQPLILLLGFIGLVNLIENRFSKQSIIKTILIGSIALIPPFFYYINYETTNLIKDAGYLDTKYITANRLFGFYFDFNQGMILTIPFILLCYIFLLIERGVKMATKTIKFDYEIFLPLVLLIISASICTMGNWNHGMAIINRYASWLSVFVLVHSFYIINCYSTMKKTILFNYFFMTQCFTTLYHQQFNEFDWSSSQHTPLAKWFLRNHPELYNPDPYIFALRTQPNAAFIEENSPYIYFHHTLVKKVLVNKNKLDDLITYGISSKNISKIRKYTKFNFDWGYIDPKYFKSSLDGGQIKSLVHEKKIRAAYQKIQNSAIWTEQVKQKAKDWGKTYEEVLRMDAEYIVSLDEEAEEK